MGRKRQACKNDGGESRRWVNQRRVPAHLGSLDTDLTYYSTFEAVLPQTLRPRL
jgi:hypothetical protein